MLTAKGIYKSYGDLSILKGVDLSVQQGEIVAIVGASGAGKSTLLQILGTLDRPDRGEIYLHDQAVHRMSTSELNIFRNQEIGFVFQFHHLLPEFTALENVCMPAFIAGKSKSETEARAISLLKRLNLEDRLDHPPAALSGGEQQRVAIARALINDPAIVLADEPSGNLDSANAQSLHKLFFSLREEFNQTFIIVTHNEQLAAMADRKLLMKDGMIQN
jgi:lipoprotein-releasing system ATP-binding protein